MTPGKSTCASQTPAAEAFACRLGKYLNDYLRVVESELDDHSQYAEFTEEKSNSSTKD